MATVSKFSVSVSPEVAAGIAQRTGENGNRSQVIDTALRRWFTYMRQAKTRLEPQFSKEEKALILDATNGTYSEDDFTATLIWASIDDAIKSDGLGNKWDVEDGAALVNKLRVLTPPECFALAEAIREWWAIGGNPDDLLKSEAMLEDK